MILELNLTDEETDALAIKTAAFNASLQVNFTPTQYLVEEIIGTAIKSMVAEAYNAAVQRLGVTAFNLPYASRKALIAQVEAAVNQVDPP
jgi:hypothetical protein